MSKKILTYLIAPLLVLAISACSGFSLPIPGSNQNSTTNTQGQGTNQGPDFANQPLESKLAIGILKLEGTDKAVTAEQAKTLLPLWKAMKALDSSTTATQDEFGALYTQIEQALTPDQVQAIKDLKMTQPEIQDLMKQYNVSFGNGQFPRTTGTPSANSSGSNSGNNGGFTGGGPGGGPGGDPGGGFPGGGFPGGGTNGNNSSSGGTRSTRTAGQNAQGTPFPRTGARRAGGMNFIFVQPVITLLQTRAGG